MANTHCKLCLYANQANSENACEFDIISLIKNIKEVTVRDEYNYIKNYRCLYGFSKDKYESEKSDLDAINLKQHIIEEAKISYYLVIDFRSLSDENIINYINIINNLDIKPQYISFIVRTSTEISKKIDVFNQNIDKNIKWKAHAFIEDIPFNSCSNIAAETNAVQSNSLFMLIIDAKEDNDLNNMVNHCHYVFRVIQDNVHIIMKSKDSLNGIFIPISIYKSMLNAIGGDLIKALSMIPNMIIKNYEIEKSL